MLSLKQTKKTRRYREIKYSILSYGFIALLFISLLIITIESIYSISNNNNNNTRHLLADNDNERYKIEGADYPLDVFTKV